MHGLRRRLHGEEGDFVMEVINGILPQEDGIQFFSLWIPLLTYVNDKKKIFKKNGKEKPVIRLGNKKSLELTKALWDDPDIIDRYLATKSLDEISEEDREIMLGWKRFVRGKFILARVLTSGGIFMSDKTYLVRGITSPIDEIVGSPVPMLVSATLIPFKGVIITDGMIAEHPVGFGDGMKKALKDLYNQAKEKGEIITSI